MVYPHELQHLFLDAIREMFKKSLFATICTDEKNRTLIR